MSVTSYELGFYEGFLKGIEHGERRLLLYQLDFLFDSPGLDVCAKVTSLPVDKLEELGVALLKAKSLQELGLKP